MKILILTYKKYKDDDGGGEEIYIKELKTVLEENEHHVDISYIFEKDILKKTTFYRRFFLKKYFFNLEVGIFSKYDIIINNTSFIVDKNYNKNVIWLQHSNLDIYIKNSNINKLLIWRNLKRFRAKTFF